MHNVYGYIIFDFCGFISVAYTTLNKLLTVLCILSPIPIWNAFIVPEWFRCCSLFS